MLLAGLVIDAEGRAMVPCHGSTGGRSQYYATVSSKPATRTRIPAARLDRNVVGVLKRVGLLRDDWRPDDLVTVVRCVVVTPGALELQLSIRGCLALWRAGSLHSGRVTVARMLRVMAAALAPGEEIREVGASLHLTVPRYSRNRCAFRRARVLSNADQGGARAGH